MVGVISLSSKPWRSFSHLLLFFLLFGGDSTSLDLIECEPRKQTSKGAAPASRGVADQGRKQSTTTLGIRQEPGPHCLDLLHNDTRRLVASSSAVANLPSGLSSLQVEALMEFRRRIVEDPHGVFLSWDYSAGSDVCSWTGVSCANSTTGVTALDLSNQQLSGTLSPSLAGLEFLSYVDLSNNSLAGIIPDKWGALQNLAVLNLSSNDINGSIPTTISNSSSLRVLDLSVNHLTGTIPTELGVLLNMEELHLDHNSLVGAIPSSLENSSSLKFLELSNNLLTGDLLSLDWGRLRDLEVISLGLNHLSGKTPETLGRLQMLQYLYLYNNSLSGAIPTSLTNCSALAHIDLKYNFFSDELPSELGRLQRLKYLDLESNLLSGRIPFSLGNCSALGLLQLSDNNMSDEIPAQLGFLALLTELSLAFNNLTGAIPATLGNCSSLEILILNSNALSGNIPKQLFQLSKLRTLHLYINELFGPIDASIGNCTALQELAVVTNHLSGSLPAELGLLKNFLRVTLFQNSFTGIIPPEIGNCSLLFDVSFRGNLLTGPIPPSFGKLARLQSLRLGENSLTGTIPPELSNCAKLYYLGLFSNQLTGPIPPELGQLRKLGSLNLSNNLLTGPIPSSLANCVFLYELDLANNKLTGPIPSKVLASLTHLQTELNLSRNQLSGPIPPAIGLLNSVQIVDLCFNNLSGAIPTALGFCRGLQSLNLSSNNLEGEIPDSLTTLPDLHDFNVSFNRLTGAVPDSGGFSNLTSASFIGNPNLCGTVVNRNCSSRSGRNWKSCYGISCHQKWIILGAVLGFLLLVVVLGVVVYYLGCVTRVRNRPVPVLFDELTSEYSLTARDILVATRGFSEANIVGAGAKSTVYKGVLPWGMNIAVKKIERNGSEQESMRLQLRREVQSLGYLRHRNLLKIYDFCSNGTIEALVLEYMPNGSLWKHLYNENNCPLDFDQRLDIAIGVSEALVYLHYECPRPVIHLDLKPSNILLDEQLVPKLADFGISRFVRSDSQGEASVSSSLHGTIGYIPPEYGASTNVSTKGDVYSFGVVLFELVTRKQPTDNMFNQGLSLRDWVMHAFPYKIIDIIDKSHLDDLLDQEDRLRMMLHVGLLCTLDAPSKRPTMKDARKLLMHIKTFNDSREGSPSEAQILRNDSRVSGAALEFCRDRFQQQPVTSRSTSTFSSRDTGASGGALEFCRDRFQRQPVTSRSTSTFSFRDTGALH